ncbi:MAG: SDR family NAD(P)-dependent oxidoreductase [Bacteroidales bacterium]|nr:SDR family NAD(P)-dependent oxidoreductase [Bacteroidales bacterium]
MSKSVLITGSTDGIGKATAIELAKKGYSIHVLGLNKERGEHVLKILKQHYPKRKHELFCVDLSKMKEVNLFLDAYIQRFKSLDVLILNAGIFPKKTTLSDDGIDMSFSVGYISRYLFSIKLNKLLVQSPIGEVVHINGSVIGEIKYSQLQAPKYNTMTSVWQNSVGSALLVHNWNQISNSNVSHMHWNPGVVNTQTVKSQGAIVRYLSKLMGMIEPEQAGQMLASHIDSVSQQEMASKFYSKGKLQKTKSKILKGQDLLKELLEFSKSFTQTDIDLSNH